jgi:hypothetical protein
MFDETDELYDIDENEDEHRSTNENGNNTYSLLSQSKTSTL